LSINIEIVRSQNYRKINTLIDNTNQGVSVRIQMRVRGAADPWRRCPPSYCRTR